MSSDLVWEHQYCLGCDKQTDGTTYCSESCRLSDFDNSTSTSSSPACSPRLNGPAVSWTSPRPQTKFFLPPAYDFSNAQPYGTTPRPHSFFSQRSQVSSSSSSRALTPSSSHSSLCSLRSISSASTEDSSVSDKARKELRDYASSFEHARLQQRRRSY